MLKRVISFLLCVNILVSMLPVQSFATEDVTESTEQIVTTEPLEETTEPSEAVTEPSEEVTMPTVAVTEPTEEITVPTEFVVEVTEPEATTESEPVCTGFVDCPVSDHDDGCEKKAADEKAAADLVAADSVAALIDALPSLEEIQAKPMEEQGVDYNQVYAAYDAYGKLTEEQKALLPPAEDVFKPYFDYFSSLTAEAATYSGTCGTSATWQFNTTNGELTIGGSGAMSDYGHSRPWEEYIGDIVSIKVGNSITYIGSHAFRFCSNVTSVSLPNGLHEIGQGAFLGCSELTSVTLPKNVKLHPYVFQECTSLSEIVIPSGVTYDNETSAAFSGCSGLTKVIFESGANKVPDYIFEGCTALEEVELPDSITTIGDGAFCACSALETITFPESVTTVGGWALMGCEKLGEIIFTGNAPEITDDAFQDITANGYYPPNNDTWTPDKLIGYGGDIDWQPYGEESSDTEISGTCGLDLRWKFLRKTGVLTISGTGKMADYPGNNVPWKDEIQNIKSVVINDGPTTIGIAAFRNCSNLISISLPSTIKSIGNVALENCSRLTDVSIQPGIETIGWGVFQNCSSLKSINLPEGIISIGTFAFRGCTSLNTIVLPDSISTIDVGLFENCSELHAVGWPEGLSTISDRAFASCSDLNNMHIPEGVRKIGSNTFENCSSLSSIYLPASLAYIEEDAFKNCSNLVDVYITDISAWVNACDEFKCNPLSYGDNNKNLYLNGELVKDVVVSDIEITGDMPCVGAEAFYECDSLQSICLGDSITEIGQFAFYGCDNLSSVTLGKGVTSIQYHAFEDCTKLKSINLPMSVTILESQIFTGTGIYEIIFNGDAPQFSIDTFWEMEATAYYPADNKTWTEEIRQNYGGKINWQPYVDEPSDTEIGGTCGESLTWSLNVNTGVLTISGTGAMTDYKEGMTQCDTPWITYQDKISRVVVENGVTTIGAYAFYAFDLDTHNNLYQNLTQVVLGDSVESIGEGAFCDCFGITELVMPDTVVKVDNGAFSGCIGLESVTWSENLKIISTWAFLGSGLTELILPDGLTTIGVEAFGTCEALTKIVLPDSVTNLDAWAFSGCSALETVVLSKSLSSISESVFYSCNSLTNITIPACVTSIGDSAFGNCDNLTSVSLPDGLTEIDGYAFDGCGGLLSVVIPDTVTKIGESAFFDCTNLSSVTLSCNLKDIYDYTFQNCSSLKTVKIPDTVTRIHYAAFSGCTSLENITLPEELTFIGDRAFSDCTSLSEITFQGDAPEFQIDVPQEFPQVSMVFKDVAATAYYPANNETWTADVMQMYGGTITWIPYGAVENRLILDAETLSGYDSVWIDGAEKVIQKDGDSWYIDLPDSNARVMTTYTYRSDGAAEDGVDTHAVYPVSMRVWTLENQNGIYTATRQESFDDILQYSGISIRVTGNKGIRMITSIDENNRNALTGDGLAGYTVKEYGTVIAWAKQLSCTKPLVVGKSYVSSNYAYKKNVADPIFRYVDGRIQYTNVLVGFSLDNCKDDIAMRSYMILTDANGDDVIIYGGIVERSIGYIALRNRFRYPNYSDYYNYVWDIIRHVYGNSYDADWRPEWSDTIM